MINNSTPQYFDKPEKGDLPQMTKSKLNILMDSDEPIKATTPVMPEQANPVAAVLDSPDGNLIKLPSGGVHGYPAVVSHRDMLFRDEEILSSATSDTFALVLNKVLKGVLNGCEFYEKLSICDRDYLLVRIWATNYTPTKTVEHTCPHCKTKGNHVIDYTKVESVDIHPTFTGLWTFNLKKTGAPVTVRLNTVADEITAENYIQNNKTVSLSSVMLALSVDFGIDGLPTEQRIKLVNDNVTTMEMGKIKKFHTLLNYGLPKQLTLICKEKECGKPSDADFPFRWTDIIAPTVSADIEDFL